MWALPTVTDGEDGFELGGDAVRVVVFKPGGAAGGLDHEVVGDVPAKAGTGVPGEIGLPGIRVPLRGGPAIPRIPIGEVVDIFKFDFGELIAEAAGDEGVKRRLMML